MKAQSKFAAKKAHKGPEVPKFGHHLSLRVPENAPKVSWWVNANGDFYERAKAEEPRILQSRIHHQIVAVRIVGHLE